MRESRARGALSLRPAPPGRVACVWARGEKRKTQRVRVTENQKNDTNRTVATFYVCARAQCALRTPQR